MVVHSVYRGGICYGEKSVVNQVDGHTLVVNMGEAEERE